MLCLFTNIPLFFHIPSTNLYLFPIYYQTPSPPTSHKVWAFDSHLAYLFSREFFFTIYSHLYDPFFFCHMYYYVWFLSPLPYCCHRKQRLMKREQTFPLQQIHDLLKVLLSYRQQTGEDPQSRSSKTLKARFRPHSLQQLLGFFNICTNWWRELLILCCSSLWGGSSQESLKYLWVQTPLEVERIIPKPLKNQYPYVPYTPKLIRWGKQTFEAKGRQNYCYLWHLILTP